MIKELSLLIIQLIAAPEKAWRNLSSGEKDNERFLNRFLHPIFGLIALTTFVGGRWFSAEGNIELALKNTIVSVAAVYGGYFIASYTLTELAPRYGLPRKMHLYQLFTGYSSSALYALYLITPFLSGFFVLWIFALYTLHIVSVGAEIFLGLAGDQRMNFTIVATMLIVLSPALINVLLSLLIH